jgi:hypothetical protein
MAATNLHILHVLHDVFLVFIRSHSRQLLGKCALLHACDGAGTLPLLCSHGIDAIILCILDKVRAAGPIAGMGLSESHCNVRLVRKSGRPVSGIDYILG